MLITRLMRLAEHGEDEVRIVQAIESLENNFGVSKKISREPETLEVIQQLFERMIAAYGHLSLLKGKRILDIACGSRTSRAPSRGLPISQPTGRSAERASHDEYTALFEPWFCRILFTLGAEPVGIDMGDLSEENFEHYRADVSRTGALDFLPQHSFDAVHDSRLFGSPEFTTRFTNRGDALRIAREIVDQERRLLREGGIIIHSDAHRLIS
jgi:hypothetical protein